MAGRWSAEQVLALAPDASSAAAGRRLSAAGPWTATGASTAPAVVWGLCKGSGSTPYQTVVDLTEPAFRCTCPSRKFPCKHSLGLLLLWTSGSVPDATEPASFAATWLAERAGRAARAAGAGTAQARPATAPDSEPDSETGGEPASAGAARKRAEQRAERVASGVAELDQWLRDLIRAGLAGAGRAGYGVTDQVAARLVDAQAPGLASSVRRLATVAASGDGWPGRLLTELALLRMLAAGHTRLDDLPPALASTIRSRIGYPVRTKDVLGTRPVRDRWNVLALHDDTEDRLTTRRVQLQGTTCGRHAVVLSFSVAGQPLDASLVPGTSLDAELHFYPGALPLRAVVGARHGEPGPLQDAPGLSLTEAVRAWAAALAADPWTTELPLVLRDVVPVPPPGAGPGTPGWALVDAAGHTLPLRDSYALWTLLAVSGGHPVTLAAGYTPTGLRAAAVRAGPRMVGL